IEKITGYYFVSFCFGCGGRTRFGTSRFRTAGVSAVVLICRNLKIILMTFTKLVPNVFYKDIRMGLKTFVDCLEFTVGHDELNSERPFCVVEKDGLRVNLFQDKKYAEEHNPEFRLLTDDIEE